MFAIPGIAALIVFILARPQEAFPLLQRVPFLHLFTVLAVLGWVIDVRLRRTQPIGTPALPWAVAFLGWAAISVAIVAPAQMFARAIEMAILFALYGTIAHGVQKFRTFQIVAGVTMLTCGFISVVCLHQAYAGKQCVAGQQIAGELTGHPDGRPCETNETCYGPDAEPGLEYRCEHVGLLGTSSVEGRVRYRGELQDPNEVALTITAGALSLLLAFARRRHNPIAQAACIAGMVLVVLTVLETQSRGGLASVLLVVATYAARRYGLRALIPLAIAALPVLLLSGRGGAAADASTQLRYEAWAKGLTLFRRSPIWGVGAGQFSDHHFLTAHNSFVLSLAETGIVGLILFVSVIYVSLKSLVVGLYRLRATPGAQVAQVWGMALLASMAGMMFQINTLSFSYKSILWIFFGLIGAWVGAIRAHAPEFSVRLTWRDLVGIVAACLAFVIVFLPLFLRAKGEL